MDTGWLGGGVLLVAALVGWWWIARSRNAGASRDLEPMPEDGAMKPSRSAVSGTDRSQQAATSAGETNIDGASPSASSDPASISPAAPATTSPGSIALPAAAETVGTAGEGAAPTPGGDTDTSPTPEPTPITDPASADPAADTVLVKATNLTSLDAAAQLAKARADLWANRWLLGNQVCEDLQTALDQAQEALDSWYLTAPPRMRTAAIGLRPHLSQVERAASALTPLRRASFAAAANATAETATVYPAESTDKATAIPSDSEVIGSAQDLENVSSNPSGGLTQLAREVHAGVQQARLEVARLAPTAGSAVSTQLRNWLSQANIAAVMVSRELATPGHAPLRARHLQQLEAKLLGAIWRRRLIALVVQYRRAHDWAQTTTATPTWLELAQLATTITALQADLLLREATISEDDLATLARLRTLTAGSCGDQPVVHQRTCVAVVNQCEQLWQRWRAQFAPAQENAPGDDQAGAS